MEDLSNVHLTRQLDIIPIDVLGTKITIIGAGAIGSFVTLALAKMGFGDITVYDFDKIEEENLNSQFYRRSDLGKLKVRALEDLVADFTNTKIEVKAERYEHGTFAGIVISAVDSMAVRKQIWKNHKDLAPFTKAIIDPRMGAETALLYCMNPMDKKDQDTYEKTLYTDESAVQERCTNKAVMYTVLSIAGLVCIQVKGLLVKGKYGRTSQWDMPSNQLQSWPN